MLLLLLRLSGWDLELGAVVRWYVADGRMIGMN